MTLQEIQLIVLTAWHFMKEEDINFTVRKEAEYFVMTTTLIAGGQEYVINSAFFPMEFEMMRIKTKISAVDKVVALMQDHVSKLKTERLKHLLGE